MKIQYPLKVLILTVMSILFYRILHAIRRKSFLCCTDLEAAKQITFLMPQNLPIVGISSFFPMRTHTEAIKRFLIILI